MDGRDDNQLEGKAYLMADNKIIWTCCMCGSPIDDGVGYVEHPANLSTEFEGWRAIHRGCDPDQDDTAFWSVERLRGLADLRSLAEHGRAKRWWSEREWSDFLAVQLSSPVQ